MKIFIFCVLMALSSARFNREIMAGDYTRFYTADSLRGDNQQLPYDDVKFNVYNANWFSFKVKACNDAHIGLFNINNDIDKNEGIYEIVIGSYGNSRVEIRPEQGGVPLATRMTPDVLNCAEFRTFWIHWNREYIEVGYGPVEHEGLIIRADRPEGHRYDVSFAGFATGWRSTGVWEIMENSGTRWNIATYDATPLEYQAFTKSVTQRNGFFTFEINGCAEAHIAMADAPKSSYNEWAYHVVLGAYENTKTCIHIGRNVDRSNCNDSWTGEVLDCNKYLTFWLSWQENTIRVGRGLVYGVNQLHSVVDPSFTSVGVLSFATGWGEWQDGDNRWEARWVFEDTRENRYIVYNDPDKPANTYNLWMMTPRQNHIQFRLKHCKDAYLAIYSIGFRTLYEAYIGTEENTKTILRTGQGEVLAQEDTPNILRCTDMQGMWMSWWNGHTLRIGMGNIEGRGVQLEYELPEDFGGVADIGFGNPQDPESVWIITRNEADETTIDSPTDSKNDVIWITVESDVYKIFNVERATKNVRIVVSEFTPRTDIRSHEIIIGLPEDGKVLTVINNLATGSRSVSRETPNVLNKELNQFYVAWYRGYLRVGEGYDIGQNTLVSMGSRVPHQVNALGFSSLDERALFTMENDVGDWFWMAAVTREVTKKWSHVTTGYQWIYFQAIGSGARLILSDNYQSTKNAYYFYLGDFDNTQTTLYKNSKQVAHEVTDGVMELDMIRSYWVSWENGNIAIGKSMYRNVATLLQYKDSSPIRVEAVSVTRLDDSIAAFKFFTRQGMSEFSYDTQTEENWDQVWVATRRISHITFAVKACSDVKILLGPIMHGTDHSNTYLITIDGFGNMSTIEGPYSNGNTVNRTVYVQRPSYRDLHCNEERIFWLSFAGGHIAVGRGNYLGRHTVISHHDFDPLPVRAIGFSTANGVAGEFRYTFSASGFRVIRSSQSGLTGGEVAGTVIGFLALFTIFGALMFILIKPPEALKPYILPPEMQTSAAPKPRAPVEAPAGSSASGGQGFDSFGMDNPTYADEAKVEVEPRSEEDVSKDDLQPVSLGTEAVAADVFGSGGGDLF